MKRKAIFKGRNGSCGFLTGQIYDVEIYGASCNSMGNTGWKSVPYGSIEAFLTNWEIIPNKDLTQYYRTEKIKRILNELV
jgi:hypothetical protein